MLRDITIGQYYNTKSPVHSLDPRTKLILLLAVMVMIFALSTAGEYIFAVLLTIACVLLSKVPLSYIARGMKPVWLLVGFTALINMFMGGGETVIFEWSIFKITFESLMLAVEMMIRVVLLVIMSNLLSLTTSPMELTVGIEKLLKPLEKIKFPSHEIAMMMSIALRFIPTLTEEAEKIMKAQTARGNDFESGGIVKKAKGMIPLFVPLFISAFRRADDLAMAMECRCYRGGENRTSFKVLEYKKCDYAAFLLAAFVAGAFLICRIAGVLL